MRVFYKIVTNLLILLISNYAFARLEYAAQYKMRCTVCHASPTGGGVRNITGKSFGIRGYQPNAFSTQSLWSFEMRGLLNEPEKRAEVKGGVGIMAGIFGLQAPLVSSESGDEYTLVYSQNVGGFPGGAGSPMDSYLSIKNYNDSEFSWVPQYILVGRFHAPFGALTDEHRTYTRMQTRTSWLDYEAGALFSSDLSEGLHYDLAIVNGSDKNGGASMPLGGSTLWGSILNLRYNPTSYPILLGLSGSRHQKLNADSPYALSVYSVLQMDKLSKDLVKGSIILEYAEARYWNDSIVGFISDSNYKTQVANSTSSGSYVMFNFDVSDKWIISYKYDGLAFDKKFPGEGYQRHGIGIKHYFGPNMYLMGRIEKAQPSRSDDPNGTSAGNLSTAWILMQVSM